MGVVRLAGDEYPCQLPRCHHSGVGPGPMPIAPRLEGLGMTRSPTGLESRVSTSLSKASSSRHAHSHPDPSPFQTSPRGEP